MNEELSHLLDRIYVKCRAAEGKDSQTILSLSKKDGELLLAAFKARMVFEFPTQPAPSALTAVLDK